MSDTIVIDQGRVSEGRSRLLLARTRYEVLMADAERAIERGGADAEVLLKMIRAVTGTRTRVMPGVMGRVVQWGNGTASFPSVVFVSAERLRQGALKVLIDIDNELALLQVLSSTESISFPDEAHTHE